MLHISLCGRESGAVDVVAFLSLEAVVAASLFSWRSIKSDAAVVVVQLQKVLVASVTS